MLATDLWRLAEPFDASDIDWKPGTVTRDKGPGTGPRKGLAMAYLTSRAVQERLDAVCGPADWRNEFREGPGGGILCGLSVYVEREGGTAEWVTKWDGADNTAVEAVKGGLSGAMKRAAVQWGIGRYLYELPAQWVRLDERGRFAETPRLPGVRASNARSAPSRASPPASRPADTPSGDGARTSAPSEPRPQMAGQRRIVRPANDPRPDGRDAARR